MSSSQEGLNKYETEKATIHEELCAQKEKKEASIKEKAALQKTAEEVKQKLSRCQEDLHKEQEKYRTLKLKDAKLDKDVELPVTAALDSTPWVPSSRLYAACC